MWNLLVQQLSYRRAGLLVVLVLGLLLGLSAGPTRSAEQLIRLWQLVLILISGGISIYLFTVDINERRILFSTNLPLPRWQIYGARLLSPVVVSLALLVLYGAVWLPTSLVLGWLEPGNLSKALLALFAGQALVHFTMATLFLHEEAVIWASRWRWGAILVNLAALVIVASATVTMPAIPWPLSSWGPILGFEVLAAGVAFWAYTFFLRRRSMLTGINAFSGFPQNWSKSSSPQ